jgi:hypothetical protein
MEEPSHLYAILRSDIFGSDIPIFTAYPYDGKIQAGEKITKPKLIQILHGQDSVRTFLGNCVPVDYVYRELLERLQRLQVAIVDELPEYRWC